jgi:hypothetical protein
MMGGDTMGTNTLPVELRDIAAELPATLTREHAIEVLHMTERTFSRAVRRGELRIIKTSAGRSGRVIVPRSEILRWMSERMSS